MAPSLQRDQFLEKALPSSEESERVILGSVLLDNRAMAQAAEDLLPEEFYSPLNRSVFSAMLALFGAGKVIDSIVIGEELKKAGSIDTFGGISAITNLSFGMPHIPNLDEYIRIVKQTAAIRNLVRICNAISSECLGGETEYGELLESAESRIFTACENKLTKQRKSEVLVEIIDASLQKTAALMESGVEVVGVPSGLKDLDEMTGGFHKGELVILAARPSMGKSAASVGFALHAANSESVVAYFSLEDTDENTAARIIASHARINLRDYRRARMTPMMFQNALDVRRATENKRFHLIDRAGITPAQVFAKCRRIYAQYKRIDLIVVDYLQMMGISKERRNSSRVEDVSQISRELKTIARELQVPVIALSQLSRECEKRNPPKPIMSDLRESGSIEQDADMVMFLYREEYYRPTEENRGLAEFVVAKQRNGPTGTIKASFLKEWVRFENIYGGTNADQREFC